VNPNAPAPAGAFFLKKDITYQWRECHSVYDLFVIEIVNSLRSVASASEGPRDGSM